MVFIIAGSQLKSEFILMRLSRKYNGLSEIALLEKMDVVIYSYDFIVKK